MLCSSQCLTFLVYASLALYSAYHIQGLPYRRTDTICAQLGCPCYFCRATVILSLWLSTPVMTLSFQPLERLPASDFNSCHSPTEGVISDVPPSLHTSPSLLCISLPPHVSCHSTDTLLTHPFHDICGWSKWRARDENDWSQDSTDVYVGSSDWRKVIWCSQGPTHFANLHGLHNSTPL